MHKWGWQKIQRSVTTCFAPFFLHMLGFFTRVFFKLQPMKLASIVSFIKWLSYVLVQGWYVCVQPSFYSVVARTFFRVSQGVTFTAHLHLVPKLGMSGAVPLLLLDRIYFHSVDTKNLIFLPFLPQSSIPNVATTAAPKHWYVSTKYTVSCPKKTGILRW
jgi:hypothetical protein